MTIDDLGAASAGTETPTVTLSGEEAAAIAETYKDADEQRHAMATQLRDANTKCAAAQQELAAVRGELAQTRHQNTTLIRQNATLRRENDTLMEKFAADLREALGLNNEEEDEEEEFDPLDLQIDPDGANG